MAVLAGADFFTVEVLTWKGLASYYVLFFIQLETRRVTLGGRTQHPTGARMEQVAAMRQTRTAGYDGLITSCMIAIQSSVCRSIRFCRRAA
jgi:hypothetical protein